MHAELPFCVKQLQNPQPHP